MTDDASPENLRKFLESDDPALVRMGLSMAKGSGVPDDLLEEILWLYMMHDDATIRAAAKSTFMKLALPDAKKAVKENWKANYRTTYSLGDNLYKLEKKLSQTSFSLIKQLIKRLGTTNATGDALSRIGKTAVEPLIRAFEDKKQSSYYHQVTVVALGNICDTRAVEPLIEALSDDIEGVRASAAVALGKIGDARAVEPLIGVLSDDVEGVRRSATETLGEIGNERAVGPLIKALGDANDYVRASAAVALGKIGDARAVEPLINALEDDEHSYVRSSAAEALGKIGDARAVGPLIKALDDCGQEAAEALGKIGDERAIEPLIKALKGNWEVCQRAAGALGEIGKPAVELLIKTLQDGSVLWPVTEALGKIGDARAVEPLIKVLSDGYSDVRISAVGALGKIGKPAVEPLIKALSDNDKRVRWQAAGALGAIGDERAIEPLNKVLKDEDEHVRRYAKAALKKLSGEIMADTDKIHYTMTGPGGRRAGFESKVELTGYLAGYGYVEDDLAVCDLLLTKSYEPTSNKMKKEMKRAKKRGIRILTYQDLLKELD